MLNNRLLVDLISLWEQYKNVRLVTLPINDLEAQAMSWTPLDWSKFQKKQLIHMEKNKQILLQVRSLPKPVLFVIENYR